MGDYTAAILVHINWCPHNYWGGFCGFFCFGAGFGLGFLFVYFEVWLGFFFLRLSGVILNYKECFLNEFKLCSLSGRSKANRLRSVHLGFHPRHSKVLLRGARCLYRNSWVLLRSTDAQQNQQRLQVQILQQPWGNKDNWKDSQSGVFSTKAGNKDFFHTSRSRKQILLSVSLLSVSF